MVALLLVSAALWARTRDTRGFSQGWYFRLGDYERGVGGQALGLAESRGGWDLVHLPHSFNAQNTFVPVRGYYRGNGWYRKHFQLSEEQAAKKVFLEFGAAFSVADLYVNERHAGQFMGGYTGFSADVTGYVKPGENLVAVKVSNTHHPNILPGKEIPDYNLYGGLYREASLVIKERLYIPQHGVRVIAQPGNVTVEVKARNDDRAARSATCQVELGDPAGRVVARATGTRRIEPGQLIVFHLDAGQAPNPALWSVDSPQLYTAHVTLGADEEEVSFGIRRFEFKADEGFFLNGKALKLRGVNRHQDYAGLGNALPPRLQARDAEIIKEMGGNFVRCSHYPQHPAFLDACDRLGVLVYEEIPSWQFIGGEGFQRNAEATLREMIERDKNHPSIILWGLFNEGRNREFFERLNRIAHAADPTRLTIYADNSPDEGKQLGTSSVPDVLGINYGTEKIDAIRAMLPGVKMLTSEHTNATVARGEMDQELGQVERIKQNLDILETRPWMAGSTLWGMHDYGTDYWPVWPEQHSGIVDSVRLPKESFYYLKSRWGREPMVHIAGQPGKVAVFSNCGEVELFRGGQSLGVRSGENPARWEVGDRPDVLRAVGRCGGRDVTDELRTAGRPAALRLEANPARIAADAADVSEITVRIVDATGVTVPIPGEVRCVLDGPGTLRGAGGWPVVKMAVGVGRILVQSDTKPGTITVRAAFGDLPPAVVMLRSE